MTEQRIERAVAQCDAMGFVPSVAASARATLGYLAGSDEERLSDLQTALDDPAVDAVWALRGGYGATRIISRLDLAEQRRQPKPFIGFSDNTAIHAAYYALGAVSFHGPHAGGDFPTETEAAFRLVLCRAEPAGQLPVRLEDPAPSTLRGGTVEAPLYGGNLALLASLCGTALCPSARGTILFLEDVGEPAYRVDRMLVQLRESGVLVGVVGLAFGRFTDSGDESVRSVRDVLLELAELLRVPAVIDLPIGHVEHNWTMPIGCLAQLNGDAATLTISEPAVCD